jgi:transcriptional regulator with XRE-family HTH domain
MVPWFGERLRQLRLAKNMTQRQLAKLVGVGADAVLRWENSKREPTLSHILDLAVALDADIVVLLKPPGEMVLEAREAAEQPTTQKKKRARVDPRLKALLTIADGLGISVDELACAAGPTRKPAPATKKPALPTAKPATRPRRGREK